MSSLVVPEVKQVTIPQVILVLGLAFILMSGLVIMALAGLDVVAILSGLVTASLVVATLFGINLKHSVDEVKELANGRLTQSMNNNRALSQDNKELHERVASLSMLIIPENKP
jgi:hypothetical protein